VLKDVAPDGGEQSLMRQTALSHAQRRAGDQRGHHRCLLNRQPGPGSAKLGPLLYYWDNSGVLYLKTPELAHEEEELQKTARSGD
jgi:hypothetical protein